MTYMRQGVMQKESTSDKVVGLPNFAKPSAVGSEHSAASLSKLSIE